MGWPKGVKRGPRKFSVIPEDNKIYTSLNDLQEEKTQPQPKKFTNGSRWTMKAGANWEDSTSEDVVGVDKLNIPREMFPDGMDLQWVTDTVFGQTVPQHRSIFERKGWTPVHPSDFDGRFDGKFTPKGFGGEISYEGLVLMARPLELSLKAKRRDQAAAREQISIKEQALTSGKLENVTLSPDHSTARNFNHINKSMERIEIPRD